MPDHGKLYSMSTEVAEQFRAALNGEGGELKYVMEQVEQEPEHEHEPIYCEKEPQQGGTDFYDGLRERLGNNKAPFRKEVARRKAKLAQASKKRNRK